MKNKRLGWISGAIIFATMALIGTRATSAEDAARLIAPLPDPLIAADGTKIDSTQQWLAEQRPRFLELFESHVYGRAPAGRPNELNFEVLEQSSSVFEDQARKKIVRISYRGPDGTNHIDATIYSPKNVEPTGCFVLIVNRARAIITEAETEPMEFWPVESIVSRGYATVAFHYSDAAVDRIDDNFQSGVFSVYGPTPRSDDSWGAIAAWAWGASRVIDFLESDSEFQGKPIAVIGHSRGGKAALWCGAQDSRVALTISNNSGAAGAALARRTRGENVETISRVFPHWFAKNYRRFANNESALPIDQHLLIALTAPRLVYVASAREDAWADPSAEFAACVEAAPVFKLFGLTGVGPPELPTDNAPRHEGSIGYHVRPGGHNLLRHDWNYFMDFTDRKWRSPRSVR